MDKMFETKAEEKEYRRHIRAFAFAHRFIGPVIAKMFNYEYEGIETIEGPYLLLANHTTDLDPAFVGLATKNQAYFVASDHLTRKGIGGWLLKRYFRPIIHTKGKAGTKSLIEIKATLKKGISVAMFPEGNRTFNGRTCEIPAVTGKLAKKSGVKLVTYRLSGGYFSQPRWGKSIRKGKMKGSLVHVYESEDLERMSVDEINQAIAQDLYEDAYETQVLEPTLYKGKKLAYGMEAMLFMCPECNEMCRLSTTNQKISCECGYEAVYNEYGQLIEGNGKQRQIIAWDIWQKEALRRRIETMTDETIIFKDLVTVRRVSEDHKVIEEMSGCMSVDKTGFYFESQGERKAWDVRGLAICGRNTLEMHLGDTLEHYEIQGDIPFNGLKYMYYYEFRQASVE